MRKSLVTPLDSVMSNPRTSHGFNPSGGFGGQCSQVSVESDNYSQSSSWQGYSQQSFDRECQSMNQGTVARSSELTSMQQPPNYRRGQNKGPLQELKGGGNMTTQNRLENSFWRKPTNFSQKSQRNIALPPKDFIPKNMLTRENKVCEEGNSVPNNVVFEFEKKMEIQFQKLRDDQTILADKLDKHMEVLDQISNTLNGVNSMIGVEQPQLRNQLISMAEEFGNAHRSSELRLQLLEEKNHWSKSIQEASHSSCVKDIINVQDNDENQTSLRGSFVIHDQEGNEGNVDTQEEEHNGFEEAMSEPLLVQCEKRSFDTPCGSSDEEDEAESVDLLEWTRSKKKKAKSLSVSSSSFEYGSENKKRKKQSNSQHQHAQSNQGGKLVKGLHNRNIEADTQDSCSLFNDCETSVLMERRKLIYENDDAPDAQSLVGQEDRYEFSDFQLTTSSLSQGF